MGPNTRSSSEGRPMVCLWGKHFNLNSRAELCLHEFHHSEQSPLCSTGLDMRLDSETNVFECPTKPLWCLSKIGRSKHSWFDTHTIPSLDPVPCKQMLCRKWKHFLKQTMTYFVVLFLGSLDALSFPWKDPWFGSFPELRLNWFTLGGYFGWTSQASYWNAFNKEINFTGPFSTYYSAAKTFQWHNKYLKILEDWKLKKSHP